MLSNPTDIFKALLNSTVIICHIFVCHGTKTRCCYFCNSLWFVTNVIMSVVCTVCRYCDFVKKIVCCSALFRPLGQTGPRKFMDPTFSDINDLWCVSAQRRAFGGSHWNCCPFRGHEWAFSSAKYQTYVTAASIPTKICIVTKTTKYFSRVVQTCITNPR